MLENIFGYGHGPGWGLDMISRASTPQDFDSVRRLLAPEGPVLSLVYSLMADSLYEFPINSIPVSSDSEEEFDFLCFYKFNVRIHLQTYMDLLLVIKI